MVRLQLAGREREFKRAIELNPDFAKAHRRYAWYLIAMGKTNEESPKTVEL